jgi:hypothetical protein
MAAFDAIFNKTRHMNERLQGKPGVVFRNGAAYYNGRHVITHETQILGGVCMGEGEREAIVVDPNGAKLQELYSKAKKLAYDENKGRIRISRVIPAVFKVTQEALKCDEKRVDALITQHTHDGEISLDKFIESGVGICRHQALTAGALLELFKNNGILQGQPRIYRNYLSGLGGHTWVDYPLEDRSRIVLDVAQNFLGPPEEGRWTYEPRKEKK